MHIDELIQIAEFLKRDDIVFDLHLIKERFEQPDKEVIIPLVGEFSSGKTSLINALTDSKKLETASKATTATIFEIRFGISECYAEVVNGDNLQRVALDELKNDSLAETQLVKVYDSSKKVPKTTVLVDTPGLSSSDARHKIALTSYLPFSDAIFLVTDINQQITRSLVDFVNTTKLSNKPIYLIINKCDTKTQREIENVKKYIAENIDLPLNHMICASAVKEDLEELFALFDHIQKNKNKIVNNALDQRTKSIALELANYIDELLKNISSETKLDDVINELHDKLSKINRNIDQLIKDADKRIDEKSYDCKKVFEDKVSSRLDSIIATKGRDCDQDVHSAVNTVSGLVLSNYGKDIQSILYNLAKDRQSRLEAVPLQALERLDTSGVSEFDFSYDMNLSSLGHKYDKILGYAAVAAVAAATIYAAGGGTILAGGVKNTVVKEGGKSILVNGANEKIRELTKGELLKLQATKAVEKINEFQKKTQDITTTSRGFLETSVGWITDNFWGKPQRRRAISNYINDTLMPEFTSHLDSLRSNLIRDIGNLLRQEARVATQQMEDELKEFKNQKETEKEAYEQKISQLKIFKKTLSKF